MVIHRHPVDGATEARVIFVESANALRVLIGPGIGQLDGGVEMTLPTELIPADFRRPNAVFWITP